ncbi:hypothetical protein ACT29H_11400 [Thermophagus sp. OGC60D27]
MKNRLIIFLLIFCHCLVKSQAQDANVEKSVWGVQTLFLPLTIYNESRLTNKIALRSELSWGFFWSQNFLNDSPQWGIVPYFCLEPRYYYNFNRRLQKGKRIDGNSGNYISVYNGFQPGFRIKSENIDFNPFIFIVPMYGLRRHIGKHFNFETAIGIGYGLEFETITYANKTYHNTYSSILPNFRLAIGYIF